MLANKLDTIKKNPVISPQCQRCPFLMPNVIFKLFLMESFLDTFRKKVGLLLIGTFLNESEAPINRKDAN